MHIFFKIFCEQCISFYGYFCVFLLKLCFVWNIPFGYGTNSVRQILFAQGYRILSVYTSIYYCCLLFVYTHRINSRRVSSNIICTLYTAATTVITIGFERTVFVLLCLICFVGCSSWFSYCVHVFVFLFFFSFDLKC